MTLEELRTIYVAMKKVEKDHHEKTMSIFRGEIAGDTRRNADVLQAYRVVYEDAAICYVNSLMEPEAKS